MGFNRRKLQDQRREAAEKEAANRRATDAQVLIVAACWASKVRSWHPGDDNNRADRNAANPCEGVTLRVVRHNNEFS
jgi:hypothetical protein